MVVWWKQHMLLDGWKDEWCFRPLFGTVKAELGQGTTWANEMKFGMTHILEEKV